MTMLFKLTRISLALILSTLCFYGVAFGLTRPQFLNMFPAGSQNCIKYDGEWYAIAIIDYNPSNEGTVIVQFLEGPYYGQFLGISRRSFNPNITNC